MYNTLVSPDDISCYKTTLITLLYRLPVLPHNFNLFSASFVIGLRFWFIRTDLVSEDFPSCLSWGNLCWFFQVGSRFGESIRLGSILTDGQVGRFGDMLPAQAAGLLSSFTAGRSDSWLMPPWILEKCQPDTIVLPILITGEQHKANLICYNGAPSVANFW